MSAKTEAGFGFSALSWFVVSGCLLLVLAAGSPLSAAELPSQQVPLTCQSNISIAESVDPVDNTLFHIVLSVVNVDSSDVADVPVPQQFPVVTFFPSCSAIPCVPAGGVDFVVGSAVSNCAPETLNLPAVGPNSVDFTFAPVLELLNPGPGMANATSCDISFDVRVNPVPAVATTFNMEATTTGTCQIPGGMFTSDGSGSDDIMFVPAVPTLGELALAILALLLVVGSLVILRRRRQSAEVAP